MTNLRIIYHLVKQAILNAAHPEYSEERIEKQIKLHLAKQRFEDLAYHATSMGVSQTNPGNEQLIVSLTSHGKRVLAVHRTIESLLQQSLQPDRIVLYLGETEYQNADQLPIVLRKQMERGLEVHFVPDQRSYTKLLPALREFPESTIITFDDDTLYPVNVIERLVNAHQLHPDAICALEARLIEWHDATNLKTYNDFTFPRDTEDKISPLYIAEGFGGILYPPHCFIEDVFNQDLFMRLAPTADDLWFKAMSLLSGTPVLKVHDFFEFDQDRYLDEDLQDVGLRQDNIYQNGNDRQLKALCVYFNLYDLLRE